MINGQWILFDRFDEDMIESLFGYAHADKDKNGPKKDSMSQDASKQYVQIIDQKKAQNLAILLKALNVTTEEVCDALKQGDLLFPSIYQDKETLKLIVLARVEVDLNSGNFSKSEIISCKVFLSW